MLTQLPEIRSHRISVGRAAQVMGLSRRQALRRFHELNRRCDGRLLHPVGFRPDGRPSKFEVDAEVLLELHRGNPDAAREDANDLRSRVDDVEQRLVALRNSLLAHRRKTAKAFELQNRKISALAKVQEGFAELVGLDVLGHSETDSAPSG